MAGKSARQIAAAKRNIVKAQAASARSRKGKKRNKAAGHHYGTGRTGRKATKRAIYGSKRHGLSPTQHARRRVRSNARKRKVGYAVTAISAGVAVYGALSPQQKRKINNTAKQAKMDYKANRKLFPQTGRTGAAKSTYRLTKQRLKR